MRRIYLDQVNVARANTIRDINRQIVLNYIREREPISRADIAHETVLQRSTVSLIVEELKTFGLIEEINGESTGGRPPSLLRLRAAGAFAVGVDVSTERVTVATSDLAGRVLEQESFRTPPDADEATERIIDCVREFIAHSRGSIEGVGVSVPGMVDPAANRVLYIPHFRWRDWDIVQALGAATGLPVTADNDANAVALAELWFGRPEVREVRDFIIVLVEEGVGTGIVFDGQVYRGKRGGAGEFGHMTIGAGAPIACASGSRECWESFASERAARARYDSRVKDGVVAAPPITFAGLLDLALDGDETALWALRETAHYLGVGAANLIKGLSPEAVIVTGRIVRAWHLISEVLEHAIQENVCLDPPPAWLIPSTLGEEPTLMGAQSLVLARKFALATVI